MKRLKLVTNGILGENPVLVLVLGTCPTLAVTTTVMGGLGMGLAATFVLICSNVVISALRKLIPNTVRIPAFITVIAGFVTMVEMLVRTFVPALNELLGIYLPLIVVNCIILGRAEMFASKNTIADSFFDGLGMGLGFTAVTVIMGSIREIIGSGTWFGLRLFPQDFSIGIMTAAPGGFFTFGCLIALLGAILRKRVKTKPISSGCEACGLCEKGAEVKE